MIDAAFLLRAERRRALHLAQSLGAGFRIVPCEAPLPVLRRRLRERRGDPSEADVRVLERFRPAMEPLTGAEHLFVED